MGAADSNLTPHAPARPGWRIPAEWEPHAATWLAWPRSDGIVPTYRSDNDERALFILRECSPGRPVTGLDDGLQATLDWFSDR